MSDSAPTLTAQSLRALVDYDQATGLFAWRAREKRYIKAGALAGSLHVKGYIHVVIYCRAYKAHRLAWLWMTGNWPAGQIDHRNGVRHDNRWKNLRDVDSAWNQQNRRHAQRGTHTGVLGVYPNGNCFISKIFVHGVSRYLGNYPSIEEAHQAYLNAKKALHPGSTLCA